MDHLKVENVLSVRLQKIFNPFLTPLLIGFHLYRNFRRESSVVQTYGNKRCRCEWKELLQLVNNLFREMNQVSGDNESDKIYVA